jgi:hypothetical protein
MHEHRASFVLLCTALTWESNMINQRRRDQHPGVHSVAAREEVRLLRTSAEATFLMLYKH